MGTHNDLGKAGEAMAAKWLVANGFTILHSNWRHSYHELDIVAKKDKFIHFIEVKARNYSPLGHPEDSVTKKKFKNLQKAADEYLQKYPGSKWIQYDILSITLFKDKEPEYYLLADVFL
jgi:putative endonuclease